MNWPTPPLGSLVETIVPARDKPTDLVGGIPWVRIEDFEGKYLSGSKSGQGVAEETIQSMPLRVFPEGTVVCSCSCTMGTTAIVTRPLVTNQTFIGLVPRSKELSSEFLYYALQGHRERLTATATGAIQSYLSRDDFRALRIPIPPLAMQRTITDYLDRETSRIDALIAAKRRILNLLEERWQVLMHNAVTGKLALRTRNRKPTSVPWLDDIPIHWSESLLKLVATLGTGHTPSRNHPGWWVNPTIPWITTGEVSQMRSDRIEYIAETRERISELGLANSSAVVHPAGTVVLCRTAASAGYSAIMASDMATSQDFATWTCGPLLRPRFLLLCLRAMRVDLLGRLAMGSTHKTIYMPDIESIKVPIPPVDEQDAIVEAVYARLRPLDAGTRKLGHQISLLQERRQALITIAVTGQLDIPEAA